MKFILLFLSLLFVPSAQAADKEIAPLIFTKDHLSIKTEAGKTHKFKIEIADTELKRRQGLMGRPSLKSKTGMLFVFDETTPQEFWMKDTLIPLDILFIDEAGRIETLFEKAKPHDLTPISSLRPVKAALEIGGGESARLGIKKGDLVQYKLFTK
jgi:uncharacterized membrane protein (UPF0127 family)